MRNKPLKSPFKKQVDAKTLRIAKEVEELKRVRNDSSLTQNNSKHSSQTQRGSMMRREVPIGGKKKQSGGGMFRGCGRGE